MKLSGKWLLWYVAIGVYAAFMGGVYYYNLFRWSYDEKLKKTTLDMVRLYTPTLVKGLEENIDVITMPEYDIVSRLAGEDTIVSLIYFNRYGQIRWFNDPSMMGVSYDDFVQKVSLPSDAISLAIRTKTPKVRAVPDHAIYDIAVPLLFRGEVLGVIDLQVSRAGIEKIVGTAMEKYAMGALGVLVLLGITLYLFLHWFVINPLLSLRDAIDSISFKNLDLKFAARRDEVGDAAGSLSILLAKVKNELSAARTRSQVIGENESRWWGAVLGSLLERSEGVIVVDEDNSVLYTTLPLPAGFAGKAHLLDVIDSRQQDLLRLVGQALEQPNRLIELDTVFRDQPCRVRAIFIQQEGESRRTIVVITPKGGQGGGSKSGQSGRHSVVVAVAAVAAGAFMLPFP